MDTPQANPWSSPTESGATDSDATRQAMNHGDGQPRQTGGSWGNAKRGFQLTSYIIGPIAGVIALAALVPTAIGLGAGRGLTIHLALYKALGLYVVVALCGGIVGGAIDLAPKRLPAPAGSDLAGGGLPSRFRFWRKRDADRIIVRKPQRWPWVLGGLATTFLMVAYGTGVYLGRVVDRRLTAAIAAADRDDPHWQVDDLMAHRVPVPDLENSALVVAEVVSLLPENWPSAPPPAPGQPASEKTEVEVADRRVFDIPENLELDVATAQTFRRELDEHEEAVRLARTLTGYARGRHELVLGPTLIDTLLTETQESRSAARLLAIDATLRAHEGDLDGALDSCCAVIGVGRSIGDEPALVSQLVRRAIDAVGLAAVRRVLGQGEPSDAALARLQSLVIAESKAPLLLYGLRGERATMTEVFRRIAAGELSIMALSSDPGDRAAYTNQQGAIASWGRLLFENQRAAALEWTNQAIAIAHRPPAEQPPGWKALNDDMERVRHSGVGKFTTTLPLLMMPGILASSSAQLRHHAEMGATALLLAAERHRRKTGAWPASADDIDPAILANPPVDPFSARPFHFERRDGRLIIYSIGPNAKDEHGALELKRWNTGGADDVAATAWDVALRRQTSP